MRLVVAAESDDPPVVDPSPPLDREDVVTIMETLLDIRSTLDRLVDLLEEEDGEAEEEDG